MDVMVQMAATLQAMNPPPRDRKQQQRDWNRRYYERNRERFGPLHHAVMRLFKLRDLLA